MAALTEASEAKRVQLQTEMVQLQMAGGGQLPMAMGAPGGQLCKTSQAEMKAALYVLARLARRWQRWRKRAKQSGSKMMSTALLQRQVHAEEPQRRGQALRHRLVVAGPNQRPCACEEKNHRKRPHRSARNVPPKRRHNADHTLVHDEGGGSVGGRASGGTGLVCWMVGWWVGGLVGGIGWLAGLVGWLVGGIGWLVGWLDCVWGCACIFGGGCTLAARRALGVGGDDIGLRGSEARPQETHTSE